MNLVVGLVLVVALTTLVKLGTRRLFRGPTRGKPLDHAGPAVKDETRPGVRAPGAKPKPTARTNANGQRRR